MNFLSFEKIIFHYETIDRIKHKQLQFPLHATISLGNYCNHKCLWCTAYEYQLEQATLMNIEKLVSFLKEAKRKGLKAVSYVGNGEPTAHPQFKELVIQVAKLGLEQGMFTNGYLIDRFQNEILKYFTWIRVSLDAGSTVSHDKMHDVKNHFDKIINNIKLLSTKRKNNLPTIGIQYAVHNKNLSDLYQSAEISKYASADYFSIKPVFNRGSVGERISKNSLTHSEITPIVNKIQNDFEDANFQIFYRSHQVLSHEQDKTVFNYKMCVAGFYNIGIYEDQKIIYCGPHHIAVGKLDDSIEQIEKNILKLSSQLDLTKCPAGCRYHELNSLVDDIIYQNNIQENHINFI